MNLTLNFFLNQSLVKYIAKTLKNNKKPSNSFYCRLVDVRSEFVINAMTYWFFVLGWCSLGIFTDRRCYIRQIWPKANYPVGQCYLYCRSSGNGSCSRKMDPFDRASGGWSWNRPGLNVSSHLHFRSRTPIH